MTLSVEKNLSMIQMSEGLQPESRGKGIPPFRKRDDFNYKYRFIQENVIKKP